MAYAAGLALTTALLNLVLTPVHRPAVHEDDPKVLDQRPAYRGAGYRPGAPRNSLQGPFDHFSGGGQGNGGGPLIEFPASGVTLFSWVTPTEMGGEAASGCWGYVSPAGREYAIIGVTNGTAFVDITQPSYPQVVAKLTGGASIWRDVKTYQQYAYAVTESADGGIQVFDLSQIDNGSVTLATTIWSGGDPSTHTVALDEVSGYLYRAGGGSNGIRIYSLANPAIPTLVASWGTRYVHECQVVTYTSGPYAGRQIAFLCSGYNGGTSQTRFEILDVTNKSSMFVRGTVFYSNARYSHQAWTSQDLKYVFLNDEKDEGQGVPTTTIVINIENLNAPFQAGSFTNGNPAIGHNLYTKGNLCYEANYRSGMRVFDVSNPPNGSEVAYFDTWPADDGVSFNGLWTVYPFFPSGLVIGADREKGLFVWWVGQPLLEFAFPGGTPALIDPAGQSVFVNVIEANAGDLVPGSETLNYALDEEPFQVLPLVPLGGGAYRADFPSLPCGRLLSWFVSAESTNGLEWRSPMGAPLNSERARLAFSEEVLYEDNFELDSGWSRDIFQDDATSGLWERGVPTGDAQGAVPDEDHSSVGTQCWLSGLTSNVDGGTTTLISNAYDLSAAHDPVVSYWRWYAKDIGLFNSNDTFHVYLSNDDGVSWVEVEALEGKTPETAGGWYENSFNVLDFLPLTSVMRLSFVISDLGYESTIEGAVDDVRILDYHCDCNQNLVADDEEVESGAAQDCNENGVPDECDVAAGTSLDDNGNGVPDECDCFQGQNYCTAHANSAGSGAELSMSGSTQISLNNFTLEVQGSVPGQFGLFFYGASPTELPFGDGALCVSGGGLGLFRLKPPSQSDSSGSSSRWVDFSAPPASDGPGELLPGSTWYFQYWYRDPAFGGAGFNLSNGLEVLFCN